jgi:hypothetical protein
MIEHMLVIAASTLSAARFNNHTQQSTCSSRLLCASSDSFANVRDALAPVCICFGAFVLMELSVPFLMARGKVKQLQEGTLELLLLFYPVVFLFMTFDTIPAISTVATRHMAAYMLLDSLNQTNTLHQVIPIFAMCILIAWIWQEGMPMPIADSPGFSVGCSSFAHLLGVIMCRMCIPGLKWIVYRVMTGLGN